MEKFINLIFSEWWTIAIFISACVIVWIFLSAILYKPFFKRFYDFLLSLIALIVLSPLLILLIIIGAIKMGGNPFFTQTRAGKKGKPFKVLKFRTMTNKRDENGELLPDGERLNRYGKFLRSVSLDELPQLINIALSQMSIIGPRPLHVYYNDRYNDFQKQRLNIKPGLTGLAQVSGRNAISWEEKFKKDVEYVKKITLFKDIKIIFMTVIKIFKKDGISQDGEATMEVFSGESSNNQSIKKNVLVLSCGRRVELVKLFKSECHSLGGKVICADMSSTAPALQFADITYILPHCNDNEYVTKLIELCKNEDIHLVIPTIDTELQILSNNKKMIEQSTSAIVMVSNEMVTSICNSKDLTAKFFKDNNVDYPLTYDSNSIDNINKFPVIIKPKNGSSSFNVFKVNNKQELEFFNSYVKEPIIQDCISGVEYTIDITCDFDSKPIYVVPRKRLATRGGEILKGQIEKNELIIDECKKLVSKLKPIGHITAQGFLTEDSKFKFIEINARFGGGAPMSINAGANSPRVLLQLLNGNAVSYENDFQDNIIYARFDDSIKVG